MHKRTNPLPILFVLISMLACQLTNVAPTIIPSPSGSGNSGGSNLPLKPVRFVNSGTIAATVMVWSYIPLGAVAPTTPSNASTVSSPGGNPSAYLSLPLGTYTWCYHWELGVVNGDGYIDYSHAIDNRAVVLDLNDSDTLELAERVDISVPPGLGELPGPCDQASNAPAATQTLQPTAQEGVNSTGSNPPLKPVCFLNTGTVGATVMAWSYIPDGSNTASTPSSASTVAFPGGNPSACLSLPLGTYTWCYHWELGDVNGDGYMDYSHAFDTRQVLLDETDTDNLDLAEKVGLSVPPGLNEFPGPCQLKGEAIRWGDASREWIVNLNGGIVVGGSASGENYYTWTISGGTFDGVNLYFQATTQDVQDCKNSMEAWWTVGPTSVSSVRIRNGCGTESLEVHTFARR